MSSISFSTAFSLCKLLPGNTFHVTFSIIAFLLTIVSLLECSVAQLCLTLCNSMDCSPPGSSIHGILPVRILEWVVIPFSSGSYRPGWEDSIKSQLSRAMWLLGTTIKTRKRRSRPLMKGDRPLQPRHVNYDHKWWTALSSGGKHLRMNCSGPVFSEHLGFMKYSTYAISSLSVLWS